jgi:virulence-associated protein VapD
MLIKNNLNDSSVELDKLENDINNLEEIKESSLQTLKNLEAQLAKDAMKQAAARRKLEESQSILAKKSSAVKRAAKEIETLKTNIKDIKVIKKEDFIETRQINEETYLLGLKVEGQKIALLVDSSASMTNEKLIDIIKTKNSSNKNKQQAKKWLRTKKVVEWLRQKNGSEQKRLSSGCWRVCQKTVMLLW